MDIQALFEEVVRNLRMEIAGSEMKSWTAAIRSLLPLTPGIYLIYDRPGKLLYVGESADVRLRLRGHICRGSVLVRHLLFDRGIDPDGEHGHVCGCGVSIKCDSGVILNKDLVDKEIRKAIQEIRQYYRVRVLSGTLEHLGNAHTRRRAEELFQWVLQPKYNWLRDPEQKQGWIPIPPLPVPVEAPPADEASGMVEDLLNAIGTFMDDRDMEKDEPHRTLRQEFFRIRAQWQQWRRPRV